MQTAYEFYVKELTVKIKLFHSQEYSQIPAKMFHQNFLPKPLFYLCTHTI